MKARRSGRTPERGGRPFASGTGSAYAASARDAEGEYLDGSKTYRIVLPSPVPAGQFWSFTVRFRPEAPAGKGGN